MVDEVASAYLNSVLEVNVRERHSQEHFVYERGSVKSKPRYRTITQCRVAKEEPRKRSQKKHAVGRLMPVFTAGAARECAPNIKKTTPASGKKH